MNGLQTALEKKKKKKLQPWEEYEPDEPVRRLTREEVSASVNAPPPDKPKVSALTPSAEAFNKAEKEEEKREKVRVLAGPVAEAGGKLLDLLTKKKKIRPTQPYVMK